MLRDRRQQFDRRPIRHGHRGGGLESWRRKIEQHDAAVVANPEAIETERRCRSVGRTGGELVRQIEQPRLQRGPVGRGQRQQGPAVRRLEGVPVLASGSSPGKPVQPAGSRHIAADRADRMCVGWYDLDPDPPSQHRVETDDQVTVAIANVGQCGEGSISRPGRRRNRRFNRRCGARGDPRSQARRRSRDDSRAAGEVVKARPAVAPSRGEEERGDEGQRGDAFDALARVPCVERDVGCELPVHRGTDRPCGKEQQGDHQPRDMEHDRPAGHAHRPARTPGRRQLQPEQTLAQRRSPSRFEHEEVGDVEQPCPRIGRRSRLPVDDDLGVGRLPDRERSRQDQEVHDSRDEAQSWQCRCLTGDRVRPEQFGQRRIGRGALRGSLGETSQDDRREAGWNLPPQHARRRRRLGVHALDQLLQVAGLERRLTGEQIVERGAHGVDIRAHVERLAPELFGRGELRRALEAGRELLMDVARQRRDRQPEVADLDRAVAVHEAVRGLDVAVQDAGGLRRIEPADDVEHRRHRHRRRQGAFGGHPILQRAARQQLHRDHGNAGNLLAAEDVDRVGMTDRCRELTLAQKAGALVRVVETPVQDFQRDAAPALDVLGLVDLAHAAAAEQAADAIRAPRLAGGQPWRVRVMPGRGAAGRHRQRLVQGGVRDGLGAGEEQARRAETFGGVRGQCLAAPGTRAARER